MAMTFKHIPTKSLCFFRVTFSMTVIYKCLAFLRRVTYRWITYFQLERS